MFADLVLVLNELLELDPKASVFYESMEEGQGLNIYSNKGDVFNPKNLSQGALIAIVRNGWQYVKDDEYSNYYFQD